MQPSFLAEEFVEGVGQWREVRRVPLEVVRARADLLDASEKLGVTTARGDVLRVRTGEKLGPFDGILEETSVLAGGRGCL